MTNIAFDLVRNPILQRSDNLRDPAVLPMPDGRYRLFYSRFSNNEWSYAENWSIASMITRDFITFEADTDITPKGFASPGDPIFWNDRWILPYQSYPTNPTRLYYSETSDPAGRWSEPVAFLLQANNLPWNTRERAIDPSFVVDGEWLHCFFVGSCEQPKKTQSDLQHANLVGHAITRDPSLQDWEILTKDEPMLGITPEAPDGCENVMVYRTGDFWTMVYSEGLANQHLAITQSPDLIHWTRIGKITFPLQNWMASRHGAPFIWYESDRWIMVLMGTDNQERTTFGLLTSTDGLHWDPLPQR